MQREETQDTRTALSEIWRRILNRRPAAQDDFFAIGGSSLELVELLYAVQERFGLEMSIDDLFPVPFEFGPSADAVARAVR